MHLPDRLGEMRFVEADITKAKTLLGWEPKVTSANGIQKFLEKQF